MMGSTTNKRLGSAAQDPSAALKNDTFGKGGDAEMARAHLLSSFLPSLTQAKKSSQPMAPSPPPVVGQGQPLHHSNLQGNAASVQALNRLIVLQRLMQHQTSGAAAVPSVPVALPSLPDQLEPNEPQATNARIPCPARGMPMEHNCNTAYFTVSQDTEHGADLVCSFPACRDAGIRFLYCKHCRVPASKRTFRQRHLHLSEAEQAAHPVVTCEVVSQKASQIAVDRKAQVQCVSAASRVSDSGRVKMGVSSPDALRQKWLNLLEARPPKNDKQALEQWLCKVLQVSEPSRKPAGFAMIQEWAKISSCSSSGSVSDGIPHEIETRRLKGIRKKRRVSKHDRPGKRARGSSW